MLRAVVCTRGAGAKAASARERRRAFVESATRWVALEARRRSFRRGEAHAPALLIGSTPASNKRERPARLQNRHARKGR
eukprot:4251560-Pleurochrysis_carterae.AAC.2